MARQFGTHVRRPRGEEIVPPSGKSTAGLTVTRWRWQTEDGEDLGRTGITGNRVYSRLTISQGRGVTREEYLFF